MGVVRFPEIRSSKPLTAEYSGTGTGLTNFFTVLDVTSGSGNLNRLATSNSYSSYGNVVNFKITIDGIVSEPYPISTTFGAVNEVFEIFTNSRFNRSLKVEAACTSPYSFNAGCDYSLEI